MWIVIFDNSIHANGFTFFINNLKHKILKIFFTTLSIKNDYAWPILIFDNIIPILCLWKLWYSNLLYATLIIKTVQSLSVYNNFTFI